MKSVNENAAGPLGKKHTHIPALDQSEKPSDSRRLDL